MCSFMCAIDFEQSLEKPKMRREKKKSFLQRRREFNIYKPEVDETQNIFLALSNFAINQSCVKILRNLYRNDKVTRESGKLSKKNSYRKSQQQKNFEIHE